MPRLATMIRAAVLGDTNVVVAVQRMELGASYLGAQLNKKEN